jgi:hypothetical protein
VEFSSGHDGGEHVHYLFVHFGLTKGAEDAHDSFAIQNQLVCYTHASMERQRCAGPSNSIAEPPQFLHALLQQEATVLRSMQSEEDKFLLLPTWMPLHVLQAWML